MNERTLKIRIGAALVVATCLMTGGLIFLFAGTKPLFRKQQAVQIWFPEAPGVQPDTPVKKNGILIGRVTDIALPPEGGVTLTLGIDEDRKIYQNEVCRIGTGTILGNAQLEFILRDEFAPAEAKQLIDQSVVQRGEVAGDPIKEFMELAEEIKGSLNSVRVAADGIKRLADNADQTLTRFSGGEDGDIGRFFDRMNQSLDNFDRTMAKIQEGPMADEELTNRVDVFMNEITDKFERVTIRAENQLDSLKSLTDSLSERGPRIVDQLDSATGHLDEMMEQLALFGERLNSSDSTIGQLLNDQDLYQHLNQAALNIEKATGQLGPVLRNAEVFTDKLARNPAQLGVQGALDRRRSGINYPQPLSTMIDIPPEDMDVLASEGCYEPMMPEIYEARRPVSPTMGTRWSDER